MGVVEPNAPNPAISPDQLIFDKTLAEFSIRSTRTFNPALIPLSPNRIGIKWLNKLLRGGIKMIFGVLIPNSNNFTNRTIILNDDNESSG